MVIGSNKGIIVNDTQEDPIVSSNIVLTNDTSIIEGSTTPDESLSGVVISSEDNIIQYNSVPDEGISTGNLIINNESQIIEGFVSEDSSLPGQIISEDNCVIKAGDLFQEVNLTNYYDKDEIDDLLLDKQDRYSSDLTTNSKYIVDAINELHEDISNISSTLLNTGKEDKYYINGLILQKSAPNNISNISYTILNNTVTRSFIFTVNENVTIYSRSLFNLWLYINNITSSSIYTIKSILKVGTTIISEGSFILTPTNPIELTVVPMMVNYLNTNLNLIIGDVITLDISISKDTTFVETINVVSGDDNLSRLVINNNELSANNLLDYKDGNNYSQSELNNSIIWGEF